MSRLIERNPFINRMVLILCNYTELKPIYGTAKAADYSVGSSLGVCDE